MVALPTTASAQLDLGKALGALFGALTESGQKEQPAEQPATTEQPGLPTKTIFDVLAENAPSARALQGTWLYEDASAEYFGSSPLADMAIAQGEQFVKSQLLTHGLKPGSFSLYLRRSGTGTITFGERTLTGRYAYNASKGTIVISGTVNNVAVSVSGYVRYEDGKLDILVDAQSALNALLKVYPELATDQTVQMVSGLVASFPGVYAVASFSR